MQLQLPEPSADALSASRSLQALIADEIQRHSGWISFSRFMELALYAPGLGYYSGGAAKLGKDGDFTTAPEITPLFGQTLAQVVAAVLDQTDAQIIEFGAGTGKLAHDLLRELTTMGVHISAYGIVELSGELRERQQLTLIDFPQAVWLERMPEAFSGLIIGNEVLDAMPVHLVVKAQDGWKERGVGYENGKFVYQDRPCESWMVKQIPHPDILPPGYLTEVHPVATGFMKSVADALCAGYKHSGNGGALMMIDYGFPAHEYYLPQRNQGTLMCHYRHHAHPDPFYFPGLQDITAHVDFTAMARAGLETGLDLLAYMNQAAFLLSAGLGDVLLRTSPVESLHYLPQANAVQKLTSPAEMGELFKVLVMGKNIGLPDSIIRSDRSGRL
ncbi:class I SAM-dependent methyltransferase [Oxalobacteraceae bacterium R-40]|uniref:Class I SAM-dependent methyltransferase n=1 Tax=Keguizhuia sedimenti TaxID=3064264 RepID=A0ABU1BPK9_9BURK|nr:class I SAM-dependent methyltransferase [Oxalobacteraceae bacterium R-40]